MRRAIAAITAALGVAVLWSLFKQPGDPKRMITPRLVDFLHIARAVDSQAIGLRLRVAAASMESGADKQANISTIERITRRAKQAHPDLRLIVFGEASLGLYHDPTDPRGAQLRAADPVPGPASNRIAQLARELGVYVAYGAVESAQDSLFNTLIVVGPDGGIVTKHRKMLLHHLDVAGGMVEAAPNHQIFTIDGIRFGLAICADANSRVLFDRYRNDGIDVLLYSVTSQVPFTVRWLKYWPYANQYKAWIVAANRYGIEGEDTYPGTAFIAAPNGHVQAIRDVRDGFVTGIIGK